MKQYGDQKEAVTLARAGLETGPANDPASRTLFKSDSPGKVPTSLSPDGRYFSFADRKDIWLHDLTSGQDRNLTNQPKDSKDNAFEPIISSDGKRIAYNWRVDKDDRYEIRLANLTGDFAPQKLYDNPELSDLFVDDWSRDGKSIALVLALKDGSRQIGILSVADGSCESSSRGRVGGISNPFRSVFHRTENTSGITDTKATRCATSVSTCMQWMVPTSGPFRWGRIATRWPDGLRMADGSYFS